MLEHLQVLSITGSNNSITAGISVSLSIGGTGDSVSVSSGTITGAAGSSFSVIARMIRSRMAAAVRRVSTEHPIA